MADERGSAQGQRERVQRRLRRRSRPVSGAAREQGGCQFRIRSGRPVEQVEDGGGAHLDERLLRRSHEREPARLEQEPLSVDVARRVALGEDDRVALGRAELA